MRWLIRRHGHYWPTVLSDCIAHADELRCLPEVWTNPAQAGFRFLPDYQALAISRLGHGYHRKDLSQIVKEVMLLSGDPRPSLLHLPPWVEAEPPQNVTSTEVIRVWYILLLFVQILLMQFM